MATLLLGALEPVVAALLEPLLDGSFVQRDPWFIRWMPWILAGVFGLRGILDFIAAVGLKSVANQVIADLRRDMFATLLYLPHRALQARSAGDWQSRFTYEVNQMGFAATTALVTVGRDGMAVVGLMAYALWVHPGLAGLTLLTFPLVALLMGWSSRRLRRISQRVQQRMGQLNQWIQQAIWGEQVVKTYNAQSFALQQFATSNDAICRDHQRLTRETEAVAPIVQGFAVAALALVIGLAATEAASERLSIGQFVSLLAALSLMLAPIKRLARLNEVVQRALAAAESVFSLLDQARESLHDGLPGPIPVRGTLIFERVAVHYDTQPILQAIDLKIEFGMQVAIVGASGAGKTTLLQLIPRLIDPTQGRVVYDGQDIRHFALKDWRQTCSYAGQTPIIWQTSVWENVALGRPTTVANMERALAMAGALEFVTTLPQGWQTVIGDGGLGLSGGQLSRLAIARAVLHEGPLLLLDEPTAALDAHAERHLHAHLQHLRGRRTVWLIAHRLTTVANADWIVVLDRGQIVEQGPHDVLFAQNGAYRALWS